MDFDFTQEQVMLRDLSREFFSRESTPKQVRSFFEDERGFSDATWQQMAEMGLQGLAIELGMTPLVEVHDQHDLARALAADAPLIGINNRDLRDFSVDLITTEYLAPLVPDEVPVVSESGIATRQDVERVARAGARAVLVGESLMRSENPEETIQELLR